MKEQFVCRLAKRRPALCVKRVHDPSALSAASASALWQRRCSTIYRESLCRDAGVTNTKMQQSSPFASVTHEQAHSMSEVPLNHNNEPLFTALSRTSRHRPILTFIDSILKCPNVEVEVAAEVVKKAL
jgi:hypothetical protein